jgi:hypothetical protein
VKSEQSAGELIGLAVAAVALVITFGSLLAAGLPLLTVVFGIVVAVSAIRNPANTEIMMIAAAVTTRAPCRKPATTASVGSAPWTYSSRIRVTRKTW